MSTDGLINSPSGDDFSAMGTGSLMPSLLQFGTAGLQAATTAYVANQGSQEIQASAIAQAEVAQSQSPGAIFTQIKSSGWLPILVIGLVALFIVNQANK